MVQLKDKKIIIYKRESIKDDMGFATQKYVPIHAGRLWAYVRQLSASEFYASMAVQQKEEMIFVVNWRDDFNATHFIEYRGVFYNITRVDTLEGYKRDLKVYAGKLGSQPKPGDILGFE